MILAWIAVATQAWRSEEGEEEEEEDDDDDDNEDEGDDEDEEDDDDEAAESALAVSMQEVVEPRLVAFVVNASAGNSLSIQPQGQKRSRSEDQSSGGIGGGSVVKPCSSVAGDIVVCLEGVAAKADAKSTSVRYGVGSVVDVSIIIFAAGADTTAGRLVTPAPAKRRVVFGRPLGNGVLYTHSALWRKHLVQISPSPEPRREHRSF